MDPERGGERIGIGSVYDTMDLIAFPSNWPDLNEAFDGYLAAIDFERADLGGLPHAIRPQ